MSALALLFAFLLLIPAGIFGACLPIVRELGRPTRAACALLCGAVTLTAEAAIFSLAGLPLAPAALLVPLAGASAVAGWLLCRLPESPGPENAYPGFSSVIVVLVSTLYLAGTLATLPSPDAQAGGVGLQGALHATFLALPDAPVIHSSATMAGIVPLLWLLAGLPLVAALLSMHLPLRQGWMIAAVWYAAIAVSLAIWHQTVGAEVPRIVFATLAALAVFSCAKEPRLVPFASIVLCGAAMTGRETLVAVAAIVGGAFVRDLHDGFATAARRLMALLAAPSILIAAGVAGQLARPRPESSFIVTGTFPEMLTTGLFGLSWAIPLLVAAAAMQGNRARIISMLPILAPATTLLIALAVDALHLGGYASWSSHEPSTFAARTALSMLILAAGLVYRDVAGHVHHSGRHLPAR